MQPLEESPATRYRASLASIWSALIAVYLIWGSTYLAIRYAVETTPPFLMAGVRFIISGAILYATSRLRGDPSPSPVEWRSAAIVGFFLLVGGNGGVVWAEQFVPSGLTALLVATVPLWIVVMDTMLSGGQRPLLRELTGVLTGFGGVILLFGSAVTEASHTNVLGVATVVIASFSWAAGSLYGRSAKLPRSALLGTGMEMLSGGVVLLVLACILGEFNGFHSSSVSLRSAVALTYLTVIGSAALVAYLWLLRVAPTPLVSTYAYVNPVVAVLLGYFFAQEPITRRILSAAGIIIGSVILVSLPARKTDGSRT